ncbi:MAG: class I SAM-dependent methyltransferase [Gemmatimonadota bacterium]
MTVHGWLRYAVFRRLLPLDVESILEIGAGLGAFGVRLAKEFRYTGLEPDVESFRVAKHRFDGVLPLAEEDYQAPESFDAVCAFEVLEHIEEDEEALRRWRRHVRPGGWILLSVPQGKRFRPSDERQGHFRRYRRDQLQGKLERAGFSDVHLVSYGFPVGYALLAWSDCVAKRNIGPERLEDRTAASARWMQPSPREATFRRAAAIPLDLMQRPFGSTGLGTGLVARARALEGA